MFKVLLKGFIFGLGFTLAMVTVIYLFSVYQSDSTDSGYNSVKELNLWTNLSTEEQAKKASVMIVLRYMVADDDLMIAIISEIHVKNSSIELAYNIGDIYQEANYYVRSGHSDRSATVLLLTGSPAKVRGTYYLYDDRLGIQNMPLKILIKKFKG